MFRKNNIKITANKVLKMNLILESFYHLCSINKCVNRTKNKRNTNNQIQLFFQFSFVRNLFKVSRMSESKMGRMANRNKQSIVNRSVNRSSWAIFELFVTSLRKDGGWKIESQEIKLFLQKSWSGQTIYSVSVAICKTVQEIEKALRNLGG